MMQFHSAKIDQLKEFDEFIYQQSQCLRNIQFIKSHTKNNHINNCNNDHKNHENKISVFRPIGQQMIQTQSTRTMQSLCCEFMLKYKDTQERFYPSQIAKDFNAKLRRVYDMINILQGAGQITKVQKNQCIWKKDSHASLSIQASLNHNFNDESPYYNDCCSLRQISNRLKHMIINNNNKRKGYTCNQIYQLMVGNQQNKQSKNNPSTIRRRIYQCCKVFVIVGLVKKVGKCFYNTINQNARKKQSLGMKQDSIYGDIQNMDIQINKQNNQNQNNNNHSVKQQYTDVNNIYQTQLIKRISQKLKSSQELEQFIQKLRKQYQNKSSSIQNIISSQKDEIKDEFTSMIDQSNQNQQSCKSYRQKQQSCKFNRQKQSPNFNNNNNNDDKITEYDTPKKIDIEQFNKTTITIPQPKYYQSFNENDLKVSKRSSFRYFRYLND